MRAFTPLKLLVLLGLTFVSNVAMAQAGNNDSVLNPNLADESELAAAPGLNAELAAAIIAARPLAGNLELDVVLGGSPGDEGKGAVESSSVPADQFEFSERR